MLTRCRAALLLALVATQAASVWPVPQALEQHGSAPLVIAPPTRSADFFRLTGAVGSPLLAKAFNRYATITFPHATRARAVSCPTAAAGATGARALAAGAISSLRVSVADLDESHPTLATNESYALAIGAGGATLSAASVFGALRGLETFSQLVGFDFDCEAYRAPAVSVRDAPRFPHRGLMIDTARHFQPLASIRAIVASLPYAKLNVLHWHMVDSQSFPFQSLSSPRLWRGAFSPAERYTQADVASIVEYARLLGVRIVVEFDMPGHNDAWCAGYPAICPSVECKSPLNVASNETFERVAALVHELTGGRPSARGAPVGLFPDEMIHLGGDEVNTACWEATPAISDWMRARGLSADGAYAYFVRRAGQLALAAGRRPVQWSEVYDHFGTALDARTVVHVWKSSTNVTAVLADGFDVLRNVGYSSNSWYLDNLEVGWEAVYGADPCEDVPSTRLCAKVLGGHGEMWGESVDASDLQQTVWPRLGAIAEKLWSPRELSASAAAALPRLEAFRCVLEERGIAAAPVRNTHARQAPPGPGSCLEQRRRRVEALR